MFLNSNNSNEGLISILEYMPPHATKFFLEKHTNNILIVIPKIANHEFSNFPT